MSRPGISWVTVQRTLYSAMLGMSPRGRRSMSMSNVWPTAVSGLASGAACSIPEPSIPTRPPAHSCARLDVLEAHLAGGDKPTAGISDAGLPELISVDLKVGGEPHFVIVHTRQIARSRGTCTDSGRSSRGQMPPDAAPPDRPARHQAVIPRE